MPLSRPRSTLAMVLLALLVEGPVHPYLMRQRLEELGKARVANFAQPNSVYQALEALRRQGLVAVRETLRDARRPERTIYEITDEGRRTLRLWLRTMLAAPEPDFPDFPAALSVVMLLDPEDVCRQLEVRADALARRLEELQASGPDLPRLFLLEDEYLQTVVRAELEWLRSVIEDLRAGRLSWTEEWIRGIGAASGGSPPGATERTPP